MSLRPLHDYLLVKLDLDEWLIKAPELLQIPDTVIGGYRKKSRTGRIEKIGNACKTNFKVGDKVYFPFIEHRPGEQNSYGDFRIVQEEEVFAKEEE